MSGSVCRGCGAGLGSCTYLSLILHVESDEGGGGHIPECLDLYAGVAVLGWAAVHTSVSSCM